MKRLAPTRAPARASAATESPNVNPHHGGLKLPTGPLWNVFVNLSSIDRLVQANGELHIETATGRRPIKADELRHRLVANFLEQEGERRSKHEALAEFPIWAVEAVLQEGEWDGVRKVEAAPDDQAEERVRIFV